MRRKKQKSVFLLLVFLSLCSLVFLGVQSAYAGKKKIVGLYHAGGEELGHLESIVEEFERLHPDIEFELQTAAAVGGSTSYFDALQIRIAGGDPPDVFIGWEGWTVPWAKMGVILNLDPLLEEDPEINKEDFGPESLLINVFSYNGNLYMLPVDYTPAPTGLFYNKKVFDEAGINYPTGEWTHKEYLSAAKRLTKDFDGDGRIDQYGTVFGSWFVPWLYMVWSNGARFFNEEETKCVINEPEAAEAIQMYADFINEYKVAPHPSFMGQLGGKAKVFAARKAAMALGWTSEPKFTPFCKEGEEVWYGMSLYPTFNNKPRIPYLMTLGWVIHPETKYPKAAWEWLKFEATRGWRIKEMGATAIPALKSLLPLAIEERRKLDGLDMREWIELAKNGRIPGGGEKWSQISDIAQSELDLVFLGEISAEEACKKIQKEVDKILAE